MALVRLRATLARPCTATPRDVHGAVSNLLRGLGDAAHDGEAPALFTPSLHGTTLDIGFLKDEAASQVWMALEAKGVFDAGERIGVRGLEVVEACPWAALVPGPTRGPVYVEAEFCSPLSFRRGGRDLPLPDPDLLLQILARAWRYYANIPLPDDLPAITLASVSGSSGLARLGPGIFRLGFTGKAVYRIPASPQQARIRALFGLTRFTGVGQKVAWGMGHVFARDAPIAASLAHAKTAV